jgi:hypothetical protein
MSVTKKRRKRKKNSYFTKDHENAIIEYSRTSDLKVRTKLYVELIGPALSELVDKIVYTYKFNTLPNIDSLKEECKIWLTTILDKYDPSKGSKAFSYFSVVSKHWFIHKYKKTSQKNRKEVSYEEMSEKNTSDLKTLSDEEDIYMQKRSEVEFWNNLLGQVEKWDTGNLKENEQKVLDAVKILLENVENIEIFNKKAVYLYLREITGLNTKQIVNHLNKMREKYRHFKNRWNRGEI